MRIDSHLHFRKYEAAEEEPVKDDAFFVGKDYLPEAISPTLQQLEIDGCVAIQNKNDESENDLMLQLAKENSFIKGVVCWTDLQTNDVEQKLVLFRRNPLIKGFRHILQADDTLLLQPSFKCGVELLSKNGFTYDIAANTEQLRYAYQLASQLPYQQFVVDHAGYPPFGNSDLADWKRNISMLSPLQNVFCKIPGITTATKNGEVNIETIRPYLDVLVTTFGTGRLMYGSNWPYSLLIADYKQIQDLTETYFQNFSNEEKEAVFGKNAAAFYKL